MWIVASNPNYARKRALPIYEKVAGTQGIPGLDKKPTYAHSKTVREQQGRIGGAQGEVETLARITDWWDIPRFAGVDDGRTNRMDRVRITGNMQVPGVVKLAWEVLGVDY